MASFDQKQVIIQSKHPSHRSSHTQSLSRPSPAEPQAQGYQRRRIHRNPCGCWCCDSCNLRVCLIANAVCAILVLGSGIFSLSELTPDCEDKNCKQLNVIFVTSVIFSRLCEIVAAVTILVACCKGSKGCATAGGYFYWLEMVFLMLEIGAYYNIVDIWPQLTRSSEVKDNERSRREVGPYKISIVLGAIGEIVWCLYIGICCFQLREQIELGIDLLPTKYEPKTEDANYSQANEQPSMTTNSPAQYRGYEGSQYNTDSAHPPPQYADVPPQMEKKSSRAKRIKPPSEPV